MARVMSFVMMVFITVPIVAPAFGEAVVLVASWPWIFGILFATALCGIVWAALRLPETRPPDDRVPLTATALGHAFATVVGTLRMLGYTIAVGFVFGCLLGYVSSAQQVFVDLYGLGQWFPLVFGAVAAVMALASVTNARLVGRPGMRRLSHSAMLARARALPHCRRAAAGTAAAPGVRSVRRRRLLLLRAGPTVSSCTIVQSKVAGGAD